MAASNRLQARGHAWRGAGVLLEYLDDRWRSPQEVERVTGFPAFGVIPEIKVSKKDKKGMNYRKPAGAYGYGYGEGYGGGYGG